MAHYRRRPLAAAVILTLSAAPAALAQSKPEQTLPEVRVQGESTDGAVQGYRANRSSTFNKTDTPLKDIPASITVVPSEVIKDAGMQSLGDVFRYVPGVMQHQGEGNRDQIILRGNSTTADFYVDGVRDDAQVFRDLYNLERVEVLKGPSGMIFGRGGAGGIVNRVTRKPVFDTVKEANVTVGSWHQVRGTVDLGAKVNGSAAWRLNGMAEHSDSFRNGATLERFAINPTLTVTPSSRTSLTFGYEHLEDRRTADRGIPSQNGAPFLTDPSTFFGNTPQSNAHSYVDGLYAVIDHDLGSGAQLRNTTRVTYYDKYYQNVYPGSAVNAAGNLTLSAYNNSNDRTNFFNQTDITKKITVGGMEHTLLAGLELGHQDSANKRNTGFFGAATGITVSAANPFALATSFRPNGTDADNKVKADIAGAYLQDQLALTPQWKVVAGLRYDYFNTKFDDRRTTTPAVDLSRTDTAVSPRLGMIWQPTSASTYYASYSYAFLPSGEQLSLATTTADLEPETAKNYEIGARWDVLPGLSLSTAVFRLDRDNVKAADPVNPGFFVKTGQQRTEGLEIGLQGDVTPRWQVFGGYSHLDARVEKPFNSGTAATIATIIPAGSKVGLVPENMFSLWNRYRLDEHWSAGLGLIHQSSYFTSFNNLVSVPGFSRADAALYYDIDKRTRVALNVENIFDKNYYPTVDGDNNISPGAPRNARITLSTRF
ncbi:MAG TPA: TonB-dependent siderophore receptor [Burkholderiales bacterium]|nr:TonB-dependent siderophore receptor [Burkholderiales bacterium]